MRSPINALVTEKTLALMSARCHEALIECAIEDQNFGVIKNVCAKVASTLSDEIDEVCGLLSIPKRQFLEAAMRQAVAQAREIMAREGVEEFLTEQTERLSTKEVA